MALFLNDVDAEVFLHLLLEMQLVISWGFKQK